MKNSINVSEKKKKNSSLLRKGFSLSLLTLFSRILGLIREITKAKFLGTSAYSDAFGIAFMIPNLFRRLFAENSISVAFIPTFRGYLEDSEADNSAISNAGTIQNQNKETHNSTQEFINATFTFLTFITVLFVSLGMIFAPLILRIFYKTQDYNSMQEAIVLTRIMFPYLVVISIAAFFQGILNGMKIFSPSGFTPILFNSIVIALTYILSPYTKNPARAMAIGVLCGGIVQASFQLPFVIHCNWKIQFTGLKKAFTNKGTKKVIFLVGPTIIGMAAYQLNDIVSSALATRTGEGIYSSLSYSLRLQELILGICAVTIGTVILPDLTGFAKKNNWTSFSSMLSQSIKIMALIAIPITFYSLIMGENIIKLLFGTGRFNEKSAQMTVQVFRFHIIGLFFIAVNRIVSPAFYAQQDTKSPTFAGLANFAVNMLLATVLSRYMQGNGIALALTIASLVNMILLFIFLKKNKNLSVKGITIPAFLYSIKIIIFSIIASIPVYLLRDKLIGIFYNKSRIISQGFPVAITAIIFGIIGIFLLVITKDSLLINLIHKFTKEGKR